MKIFMDTAEIEDIKKYAWLIDGVTTNPSLIMQSGADFKTTIKKICNIIDGPVSAETISLDEKAMMAEARKLSKIHKNVVVKVPMTENGLKVAQNCHKEKIRTNVTVTFSANQALLAAKAGATFVSPFVGRIDDIGGEGMQLIEEIVDIFNNYDFETEVLAASLRHPLHVTQAALVGSDVATIPPSIIDKMFKHPLTDKGIDSFLKDWEKVPKNKRI